MNYTDKSEYNDIREKSLLQWLDEMENHPDVAVRGALMVLGALGVSNPGTIGEFTRRVKSNHDGMIDCADLLRANAEAGNPKKIHCDGMICEAINLIEEYRKEK